MKSMANQNLQRSIDRRLALLEKSCLKDRKRARNTDASLKSIKKTLRRILEK